MSENSRNDKDIRTNTRKTDSESPVKLNGIAQEKRKRAEAKKRKAVGTRAVIICSVLVLLCGSVAIAAAAGFFTGKKPADESEVSKASEVVAVVSQEPEESAPVVPTYAPTGEFKADLNKFPTEVRQELTDEITSKYVVLYDATADKVLFQKNGTMKCYPASTTKIMTAIVSSQILDKDDVITVGDEIKLINWDSSTAGLVKGMKLTYEMLLDALLLPSGNDAAYTIAVNSARKYTGDDSLSNEDAVKVFMDLVNQALKDIGCKDTHYVTPDGWHDDDHYTTATDLARMGAYARTIDIVRNSMSKTSASWELLNALDESSAESSEPSSEAESSKASDASEQSDTSSETSSESEENEDSEDEEEEFKIPEEYDPDFFGTTLSWTNTNALLNPDSEYYSKYSDGIKTGFTDEAGTSVVCSATMNNHNMIAVVMMGVSMYAKYEDANRLFEEGFKLYNLNFTHGIAAETQE